MRSAFMLVLFLYLILNSTAASANPVPVGILCVYGEPQGSTNCNIDEISVLVLHFYYYGNDATAIEFRCDISETVNWSHIADSSPFPDKIGNFHDGTTIKFLNCLTGTIYLGSAVYFTIGDTPPCSHIYLRNHPIPSIPDHYGLPVSANCWNPEKYFWAATKESVINPTQECSCICCPISTEESSWGHIKALFK